MKMEVDSVQLVGIWLMLTGIVLHSIIFLATYIKIATHLTPDDEEEQKKEKEEEEKGFPIIRFIVKVRQVLKVVMSEERREQVKRILSILDWIIISAFGLIIVGFLVILIGTIV
jgi:hypothetical protein